MGRCLQMSKIKSLILDLDDTLYDEKEFVVGGFKNVAQFIENELQISQTEFFKILWYFFNKNKRKKVFDDSLKYFSKYHPDLVEKMIQIYRLSDRKLVLSRGTKSVLIKLKSCYKLGLITDGLKKVQEKKLKILGLKSFFDKIIYTNGNTAYEKPNVKPFKEILEEFGIKPNEVVSIGNDPKKDFFPGNKLGIHTVMKSSVQCLVPYEKNYQAKYKIKNMEEIFEVIKRIENYCN